MLHNECGMHRWYRCNHKGLWWLWCVLLLHWYIHNTQIVRRILFSWWTEVHAISSVTSSTYSSTILDKIAIKSCISILLVIWHWKMFLIQKMCLIRGTYWNKTSQWKFQILYNFNFLSNFNLIAPYYYGYCGYLIKNVDCHFLFKFDKVNQWFNILN